MPVLSLSSHGRIITGALPPSLSLLLIPFHGPSSCATQILPMLFADGDNNIRDDSSEQEKAITSAFGERTTTMDGARV